MRTLPSAAPHHLVTDDAAAFPAPFRAQAVLAAGPRATGAPRRAHRHRVRRARVPHGLGLEGVSAARHGVRYRAAARAARWLPHSYPPIFTPATKDDRGHDENISYERMVEHHGRRDRGGAARALARDLRGGARLGLGARAGARRHEVRVRTYWRRVGADRRGAHARRVALLGPRGLAGGTARELRQAVRARLARPERLESRAARTTAARRGRRRTQSCYLEAVRRLTGAPR